MRNAAGATHAGLWDQGLQLRYQSAQVCTVVTTKSTKVARSLAIDVGPRICNLLCDEVPGAVLEHICEGGTASHVEEIAGPLIVSAGNTPAFSSKRVGGPAGGV
jgi:hypothetical protein